MRWVCLLFVFRFFVLRRGPARGGWYDCLFDLAFLLFGSGWFGLVAYDIHPLCCIFGGNGLGGKIHLGYAIWRH